MPIVIRAYQPTDRAAVAALMEQFCAYLQGLDASGRIAYRADSAEYYTATMLQCAAERDGIVYVAESGGAVIGFVGGHVGEQSADEQYEVGPAKPGIIREIFVTDGYRGSGVGERLLERMQAYLAGQGCDSVRLVVHAANERARQFYRRAGYGEWLVYMLRPLR